MRGENPLTSIVSYAYVASRLLTMRLLDIYSTILEPMQRIDDAVHPIVSTSGFTSFVHLFSYTLELRLINLKQSRLPGWTEIMSKAVVLLQSGCGPSSSMEVGHEALKSLSTQQLKGRELYSFSERHARSSDVSTIYANIGLASLAISRILQAS